MRPLEENFSCMLCQNLQNSLFAGLTEEDHGRISGAKTCQVFKKGETVFHEGTRPKGLYCVNGGKVKVGKVNTEGKEYILYIARQGDFLGYRALLGEEFYMANAVVMEEAKICFIEKEAFFEVLQKNPGFMRRVVKEICKEMGVVADRITDLAHKPVKERLAGSLLMLKESYGVEGEGSALIDLALSRDDMASIVGTATETIIRLLAEYRKDGLITFEGKKIRVLDAQRLAKNAGILAN